MYSVYLPAKYSKDCCAVPNNAEAAENNRHREKCNAFFLRKDFQAIVLLPQKCESIRLILRKTVRNVAVLVSFIIYLLLYIM
jgi:hypothetical protein